MRGIVYLLSCEIHKHEMADYEILFLISYDVGMPRYDVGPSFL